jgi:hypothetical protein
MTTDETAGSVTALRKAISEQALALVRTVPPIDMLDDYRIERGATLHSRSVYLTFSTPISTSNIWPRYVTGNRRMAKLPQFVQHLLVEFVVPPDRPQTFALLERCGDRREHEQHELHQSPPLIVFC